MKRNQIIILSVFLLLIFLIYAALMMNRKPPVDMAKKSDKRVYVPVGVVENRSRDLQLTSYGQVSPNTSIDVAFEVQGKLLRGDLEMKPGVKFRKGQMLYKVDNSEAFYTLGSRKIQLSNLIINMLADIELDFPSEKKKWNAFLEHIKTDERLPELPAINSSKERMFVTSKGVLAEYYNIRSQEARMEKYYFIAPFSGTVVAIYAEPGAVANPGSRIATIANTGDFEVRIPINLDNLKTFQKEGTTTFTDASGATVGYGKILRISDVINQNTQSVDVYYSIRPASGQTIYSGMFVNAVISQKATISTMAVPRVAVMDNKVHVLRDSSLILQTVNVVGGKPDTLFISGLTDGQQVLFEPEDEPDSTKRYVGVKR